MAEGRILKRAISESQKLGRLATDSARLLYTWLIPWTDVEGRYTADPDILKGHLFPKVRAMTPRKIERLLFDLADPSLSDKGGLIILYQKGGERYLEFVKFHEVQTINRDREAKSKIPPPRDKSCKLLSPPENSLLNKSLNKSEVKVKVKKTSCPKSKTPDDESFKITRWWSTEDVKLTEYLIGRILENNPRSKVKKLTLPQLENWFNECRILQFTGGWSPEEIKIIIDFSQDDEFWKCNILSMPKLKEKIDQLALKCQSELEKTKHLRVGRGK